MKNKVLEVINSLNGRGGAEIMFCQLCDELSTNLNIELKIIILHDEVSDCYNEFLKQHKNQVTIIGKNKRNSWSSAKIFKETVLAFDPDVINFHLSCLPTYIMAFGFRKKHWKLIQTIHNTCKNEAGFLSRKLRKPFIRKKMFFFIGISDLITKTIQAEYKKAKIFTVYNGIMLPTLSKDEQKIYDLICVARFYPQKNHKLLIDIFSYLFEKNANYKMVLVGDGPLKERTMKYAKEKGCYEGISFVGNQNDVYGFLLKSKIFVLTSLYEGNPISILEAMNCGMPIVASNVGGIPDVIQNERNGFLFKKNDSISAVKLITNLLNDKILYGTISANNAKDILKFSIKTCANEYVKVFNAVLK